MSYQFRTRCVHGEENKAFEDRAGAISFPIYQTASFGHPGVGQSTGFDYSRGNNPTIKRLEEVMQGIEEGSAGVTGFASGMAAIDAVFSLFSPGDHIILTEDLYGGTGRLIGEYARYGIDADFVDTSRMENIRDALRESTKAVFVEPVSNPTMLVTDIKAVSGLCRERGILLIVDNTFLSPALLSPHALGADLVIHSASKYLTGHNDTIAGVVSAADPNVDAIIKKHCMSSGAILAPFDAWLFIRGLKTLELRTRAQEKNAEKIAHFLKTCPNVEKVYYAGLEEHPGHDILKDQGRGYGSMISFRVRDPETAVRALERVGLITFAESLGGTESLITYPVLQTHADVPAQRKERLGIDEWLLRLSVGIEDVDDLIADLDQALR